MCVMLMVWMVICVFWWFGVISVMSCVVVFGVGVWGMVIVVVLFFCLEVILWVCVLV